MKLLACTIQNFGHFSNFSCTFEEGLHTIRRENGWGKSTLAAFIKAMLYGLPGSRAKNLFENERQRYTPWQGGTYGGSLSFMVKGKRYRVERTFGRRESEDTYALYSLETNLPSEDFGPALGEALFWMDQKSYERTTYITEQLSADKGDYADIQAKLSETQDLADVTAALARLDKRCKDYQTIGNKGSINQTKSKIAEKQRDLAAAVAAAERLSGLREEQGQLDAQQQQLRQTLGEVRSQTDAAKESQALHRVFEQEAYLRGKLEDEQRELERQRALFGGRVPTQEELDARQAAYARLESLRAQAESSGEGQAVSPRRFIAALGAGVLCLLLGLLVPPLALRILFFCLVVPCVVFALYEWRQRQQRRRRQEAEGSQAGSAVRAAEQQLRDELAGYGLTGDLRAQLRALSEACQKYRLQVALEASAQANLDEYRRQNPVLGGEMPATSFDLPSLLEQEKSLTRELSALVEQRLTLERRFAREEAQASQCADLEQELLSLQEKLAVDTERHRILQHTSTLLKGAQQNLTNRYAEGIHQKFGNYVALLAEAGAAEGYTLTPTFEVAVFREGASRAPEALSRGYRDLISLCVRFALTDALFEQEQPFMILDDPFANLDDRHVEAALDLLRKLAERRQILYFVCHSSRGESAG
ncbi:MAG: AAA family ATPase [Eubacteriales bacterium]